MPADDAVSIATDYLPSATSTSHSVSASSTSGNQPSSNDHGQSSGVELGLGLGLGIPLSAAVVGGAVFCLRRRHTTNNHPRGPVIANGTLLRRRNPNQQLRQRNYINAEIPEVVQAFPQQLAAQLHNQPAQPREPPRARTVSRGRERGGVVHHEVAVDPPPLYEDVLNEAPAAR